MWAKALMKHGFTSPRLKPGLSEKDQNNGLPAYRHAGTACGEFPRSGFSVVGESVNNDCVFRVADKEIYSRF